MEKVKLGTRVLRGAAACCLLGCCLSACGGDPERFLYTGGHADLTFELVAADGGAAWDAYLDSHGATIDGEAVSGAVSFEQVAVWSSARFTRPDMDSGAFDGACVPSGAELGWLPQGLRDATSFGVPFLGITATSQQAVVVGDTVRVKLVGLSSPSGSGVHSLWSDGFPPVFHFSSCDGVGDDDVLEIPLGHDHYNMGFSEPGDWSVTYEVSAQLAGGQEAVARFVVLYVLE